MIARDARCSPDFRQLFESAPGLCSPSSPRATPTSRQPFPPVVPPTGIRRTSIPGSRNGWWKVTFAPASIRLRSYRPRDGSPGSKLGVRRSSDWTQATFQPADHV